MDKVYKCKLLINTDCIYKMQSDMCRGNKACSFCKEDTDEEPKAYVRKERWYEKYYK